MSLQFIFGNSGAGKSQYLYQHIVKESIENPQTEYLVLVPEQFTMQTQRDLCTMHPRKGIMNIDVLSFIRLSHRIFEETGYESKVVLDDEGKSLILRKIAGQCEEELIVLRGNLKKPGYISEVKSVISEFTQYGVGVEALEEFLEDLEPNSYLGYKLHDLKIVYDEFEQFLADKYITTEELLDLLSNAVPKSAILKDSVIVLDGFTGFTPVQNRLLGELLKVCKKVIITVEMDKREDPFTYKHPYQLFALSKQMVTSLMTIAQEVKAEIEDPVYLYQKPVARFQNNPALGFLESELFRYSGRTYQDAVEGALSIYHARNPRGEAEFVASEICRLVREKGYRYRDIAVITSDLSTYADLLEKQCELHGVPIFMDYKKSILLNACVEYIRSLLAMAEQNFTYESVFRFLRTGMTAFTRDEIDRLENYVIALGIHGYKKWQSAWVRMTARMEKEHLDELNHLRVQFVEMVDALMGILKKRNKTVKDITTAVYEFLQKEKLQEKIARMEEQFQEEGEYALAKEYSQIYRIVMDLFDKFVELLGEESMGVKEYCELLDAGLEAAKVGVIPPSLDQVVIGDMERTRLNNLKVLFFLGANDSFLPGNFGMGGLLSERDKEKFASHKIALSPGAKEKTYIQKFYLYMNLTKPADQLIVSFSKVSADGKALRPAYLVQDLRRMFEALSVMEEEQREYQQREFTKSSGLKELAVGLRDRQQGLSDAWKELYTWYVNEDAYSEERKRLLAAAFYKKEPETVTAKTAEDLFGDVSRMSVSRLEKFASCAYAHFLSYGLRLAERERYQFESMDLGNIAHQSMELFSRKAEKLQLDWIKMSDEQREQLIKESVEESILNYGNTVLYSTARNEYMITRIKKLIHRSVWALTKQMEVGDFKPSKFEMKFGSGKIDRVDLCEDDGSIYVKVVDYKTGSKAFDITAFYYGLQLQLPVYMNAALDVVKEKHANEEVLPAGIFYYRIKDPLVNKLSDDELLQQSLLKELKLDGLINSDSEIIKHLEKELNGKSFCYPMERTKSGELGKRSSTLSPEHFQCFLKYTREKEAQLRLEIRKGIVEAAPYVLGTQKGCDYCPYGDICGFDPRLEGFRYRQMKKYSSDEVLDLIQRDMMKKQAACADEKESMDENGGEA